jgi:hypothetical protein
MSSLPTRTDRAAFEPPPGRKQIPVAALIGPSHLPNEMRSKSIASDGYMSHWTAANKTTKNATHSVCFHLPPTQSGWPLLLFFLSLVKKKNKPLPWPAEKARIPAQYPRAWWPLLSVRVHRQEATAINGADSLPIGVVIN